MRRVKAGEASVFWMDLGFLWISIGRVMRGDPPLFDARGFAWWQAEFCDPRPLHTFPDRWLMEEP